MATAPVPLEPTFVNIGQVVACLPEIPPVRIRLVPTPGTATEADVLRVREQERVLCELVDGVLVEKPMGYEESILAGYIVTAINNYLDHHPLGVAAGEAGMMRLVGGLLRIPDVSFVSYAQFAGRKLPKAPVWGAFPDLAVEVVSPSNTKAEIARKIGEYFQAGSRLIWIVDPPSRTVKVYTSALDAKVYGIDDTLDGGDVLPGFTLAVSRIFRG